MNTATIEQLRKVTEQDAVTDITAYVDALLAFRDEKADCGCFVDLLTEEEKTDLATKASFWFLTGRAKGCVELQDMFTAQAKPGSIILPG